MEVDAGQEGRLCGMSLGNRVSHTSQFNGFVSVQTHIHCMILFTGQISVTSYSCKLVNYQTINYASFSFLCSVDRMIYSPMIFKSLTSALS